MGAENAKNERVGALRKSGLLSRVIRAIRGDESTSKLALAEETYRSLVEQASDGIVVTDPDGKCLEINSAGCEIIGYDREEVIGRNVLDFIDPEDLASIPSRIPQIRRGVGFISERRVVQKDGTRIPVEIHAKPLTDGRIIGIYRDLRERQSQQSLMRALVGGTAAETGEEFFRSLVMNLAKAINVRCAYVGEVVEGAAMSLQTQAIWIDEHEADNRCIPIAETANARVLELGQSFVAQGAKALFPKDELLQDVEADSFFGAAMKDSSGLDIGVLGVIDDGPLENVEQTVSVLSIFASRAGAELERSRAERALRQIEQRQRALLHAIPDTLFVMTLDGVYIDYHTHNPSRLLAPPEAFLGKPYREVLPEPLIPFFDKAFDTLRKGKLPKVFEYATPKPGPTRFYEVRHAPVGEGLVLAILRDITDRKLYDAEISRLNENLERLVQERTAQLQIANQELESFAYAVSHDLRAPLRAIHGNAEILREDLDGLATEESMKSLSRIAYRAEEMSRLIDGLLKLSRIMRAELKIEDLDISQMAEDIVDELRSREEGRHVEVHIEPSLRAAGDRALVNAALINLLQNAFKFTSKKSSARIEVGAEDVGGIPHFYVRDNGAGFDMKHSDKLFGPFERLHAPGEFEGTGIGLATVQRVVRRHGGEIWAEAAPNEGATFRFTLP